MPLIYVGELLGRLGRSIKETNTCVLFQLDEIFFPAGRALFPRSFYHDL